MDLCDKFDLFDYVANANISEPMARFMIRKIVDAIEHIHSLGIFHRDIKLENFLIDP